MPPKELILAAGTPIESNGKEPHLRNIRQLTFEGENAEAYWSNDGTKLVFQSTRPPHECDQIYGLDLETGEATQAHVENRTGTAMAYAPAGSIRRPQPVERSDYEAWSPE